MELYLVRHGETEYNRADIFRGRSDPPLNENGMTQALMAGRYLGGLEFEGFYHSPLLRARQTAEQIASFHHQTPTPLEQLIDVDYGEWSGKSVEEVRSRWPREFDLWINQPSRLVFPGGESLISVYDRLKDALSWLAEQHRKRVLAVGHKVINRIMLCIALGLDLEGIWRIDQSNGAINIIASVDGRWMVKRMNDVCHLVTCMSPDQQT